MCNANPTGENTEIPISVLSSACQILKASKTSISIGYMPCQRKPDKFNCGLFAFANAITFASGGNPAAEQCQYDVSQMRGHLNRCFLDNKIIPFPLLKYLVSRPITRGKPPDPSLFIPKTYDVFCNCRCSAERFSDPRNPDAINLVECQDDDCPHIWFHPKCMEISDEVMKTIETVQWYCLNCHKNNQKSPVSSQLDSDSSSA